MLEALLTTGNRKKTGWVSLFQSGGAPSATQARMAAWGGKLYHFGGRASGGVTDVLRSYDIATGMWQILASGPPPRRLFAMVVVEGIIYIYGGYQDGVGSLSDFWSYRIATNTWTKLSALSVGAQYSHDAVAVGKTIYILGLANVDNIRQLWQINTPSMTVVKLSTVNALGQGLFTTLGNTLVQTGGAVGAAEGVLARQYNLSSGTWGMPGNLYTPVPLYSQSGGEIDGRLYMFGGISDGKYINTLYIHDGTSWKASLEPGPGVNGNQACAVSDGVIYFQGGINTSLWAYTPA